MSTTEPTPGDYDDFDLAAAYGEVGALTLPPLTDADIEAFYAAEAVRANTDAEAEAEDAYRAACANPALAFVLPTYAGAAPVYLDHGWQPLPIHEGKGVTPNGFTGYGGAQVTAEDVARWSEDPATANGGVALRLVDMVGLDVDAYDTEKGAGAAWAALQKELGALPPTVRSSSRVEDADYDGVSGIYLYRLPEAYLERQGQRVWKGNLAPGIDIVRFGHRQVNAWPQMHPKRGVRYAWLNEATGEVVHGPLLATPEDIPELPQEWAEALLKAPKKQKAAQDKKAAQTPTDGSQGDYEHRQWWTDCDPCPAVQRALETALAELEDTRHDTIVQRLVSLTRLGEQGHRGVLAAARQLHDEFLAIRDGLDVDREESVAEWHRAEHGIMAVILDQGLTAEKDRGCCGPRSAAATDPAGADRDADGLWNRSAVLATIRQFALSRMVAPEAVLFVVLARVGQVIPPHVCAPALVGGRGSLNSLLALVTRPGGGKGGATAAAADCVVLPAEVHTSNVGSGEGMAKQFVRWDAKAKEHVRVRTATLFDAAEIKGLKALMERNGATLEDQLLKMYSGESLGYGYADDTKTGQVPAHSYRGGLVVGVQVSNAKVLLDMAESGMPQRFEWARAEDAAITRDRPPEPEPVVLPTLDWSLDPALPIAWREFPLCSEVVEATLLAREQNMRGEVDALDGHAMFTRIKLACRVAVLHGRQEVTPWDWEVSGLLMARSERTRAWADGELRRAEGEQRTRQRHHRAADAVAVDEALAAAKVRGATTAIRGKLKRGSATRRALRDACGSQYRQGFVAALDALLEDGSVVRNGRDFSLREGL